jgi:hypothetical protein
MAAWVCKTCTAVYAVDLAACPQCGATEHGEEGQHDMPKISKGDGPTYEPGHNPYGEDPAAPAASDEDISGAPAEEPEPQTPDAEPDPAPAPAPKK